MSCCQCQGIESWFDEKFVAKQLKRYHKKGPPKSTRILIDTLKEQEIRGMTLLDIGGGFGAIQHKLLQAGLSQADSVEAAPVYLKSAQAEAERLALSGRIRFYQGDFVALSSQIPPADIVTLDRVICCYHDMPEQVKLSTERSRKLYGLVYPRDTWWIKTVAHIQNLVLKIRGNPFRVFIHPTEKVDNLVRSQGFKRSFYQKTFLWQVVVYIRE